jgi:hypothetical protein
MAGPSAAFGRHRLAGRRPVVVALALACAVATLTVVPAPRAAALSAWTGGISLYRSGSFTTQKTWLWCTAADIQIIRNMVRGTRDHTTSGQRRYFDWMRRHNRYSLPLSAGVDAQGWAAGMRRFVDDRYRLISSATFDSALRLAVIRMRKTNLPVGVTVSRGNHAWILVGFRATADPARTRDFKVTSVRVVGPLYGRQSKNGYDMPPNTKLTVAQFRKFFTPWRYRPKRTIWDGRYISIQPVTPRKVTTAAVEGAATPERGLVSASAVTPAVMAALAASMARRRAQSRRRRSRRLLWRRTSRRSLGHGPGRRR